MWHTTGKPGIGSIVKWVRKWCQVSSCSETLPRRFFWGNLIGTLWWAGGLGALGFCWPFGEQFYSQRFRDWASSIGFLQPLSRPLVTGPKCARGTNIPSRAFARHWWWGATKSGGGGGWCVTSERLLSALDESVTRRITFLVMSG